MRKISILWVDDEIDVLKAQIVFLEKKGYLVETALDGYSALDKIEKNYYDLIFLDENMPGISGLDTLNRIKELKSDLPVVMITKSEEEDIMEEALGNKIADFLIKPVNPNQILLTIKKVVDSNRLVSEKVSSSYQSEFGKIGIQINESLKAQDWIEVYKKIVYWEIELEESRGEEMKEVLSYQKQEANTEFSKFIKKNYLKWFDSESSEKPLMSPGLFKQRVFPHLDKGEKVFFLFIDNLRYDQWRIIYPFLKPYFRIDREELFYSILPTVTQYARNSMFAGLMPYEINKIIPEFWLYDEEEGGKNMHEEDLLRRNLQSNGKSYKLNYTKVFNKSGEKKVLNNYSDLFNYDLNVLVYNFVDILSHARTNVQMVKELADDEAAYRGLTQSWFSHSYLFELLKKLSEDNVKVIISTDHGSIKVNNPIKVIGDKETSTNLRYKTGRNLQFNPKEVFLIDNMSKAHLPERNINWDYIFATSNDYFVYPNNYNQFVNYYKNTFQHGGISLEEMLIPYVELIPYS